MKTFEQCRAIIAQEYNFTTKLLMPPQYETMAADLYAQEKLKGLLEVAKQEAAKWQTKSDKENDISNKAAYSMTAHAVNRIANRIEELIGENTKPNTPCSQ